MIKLTRDQINNIKISNIYTSDLLGVNYKSVIKRMIYALGLVLTIPGLIKYKILYFWTEQEYLTFLEQLPIEVPELIKDFSFFSALMIIVLNFFMFDILFRRKKPSKGIIDSARMAKKIIYKGKRIKALIADVEKTSSYVFIKGEGTLVVIYEFKSEEFNSAYYTTLNVKSNLFKKDSNKKNLFELDLFELDVNRKNLFELDLNKLEVYWNPEYPKLAIPASLVGS